MVENAIKHGVAASERAGWVKIAAKAEAGLIRISLQNSGRGGARPEASGDTAQHSLAGLGLGLANVSKRLQLCYGAESDLTFEPGPQMTTVRFSIPVHVTEAAAR